MMMEVGDDGGGCIETLKEEEVLQEGESWSGHGDKGVEDFVLNSRKNKGVFGSTDNEEVVVHDTVCNHESPIFIVMNEVVVNDENLTRNSNKDSPNKNLNSYALVVKIDEFPKNLEFIPTVINETGIEVVIFDEELMQKGSEKWCLTVCRQFVGFEMHINEFRYNIRRMWGKYGIDEINKGKNGQYLFKFKDDEGMNNVID
ncbi:hypothetical protein Tco_0196183 [Tanacetum coccineum]